MYEGRIRGEDYQWVNAFPERLRSSVESVVARLPEDKHRTVDPYNFTLNGEEFLIPYRIYNPEPDIRAFAGVEAQILACIYTRHFSGFVREAHLRRALETHESWMVPFVIQHLGEYVSSIHRLMLANLPILLSKDYAEAFEQNHEFVRRTKSRIISYWSCNYRRIPLKEYPAFQLAEHLAWWVPSDIPRLLRQYKHS